MYRAGNQKLLQLERLYVLRKELESQQLTYRKGGREGRELREGGQRQSSHSTRADRCRCRGGPRTQRACWGEGWCGRPGPPLLSWPLSSDLKVHTDNHISFNSSLMTRNSSVSLSESTRIAGGMPHIHSYTKPFLLSTLCGFAIKDPRYFSRTYYQILFLYIIQIMERKGERMCGEGDLK